MKNALFSGITSAQKDSDSDDEKDKKKAEPEQPAAEMNLLDFDGPSPAQGSGDLLGGQQSNGDLLGG